MTALVEVFTNTIEHSGGSAVKIEADLEPDGDLILTVRDDGQWQENDSDGVGLMIVSKLMDDVQVEREPGSTTVSMRRSLSHPLIRDEAEQTADRTIAKPFAAEINDSADLRNLRLSGVIDSRAATHLQEQLARLTQGGVRSVLVDLSEVTMLASAGVRVLQDQGAGTVLQLVAPDEHPAGWVLELTGLAS